MKLIWYCVCCCLLLLAGTGSGKQLRQSESAQPIEVRHPKQHSDMEKRPEHAVIRMKTSGGILPVSREWIFYADGRLRHPDGSISQLNAEAASKLLAPDKIAQLAASVSDKYPAPPGSADYITMELTLWTDNGEKRITAADSNGDIPQLFWQFWDELESTIRLSADTKRK